MGTFKERTPFFTDVPLVYKQEFENELIYESFSRLKYISPTVIVISLILIFTDFFTENEVLLVYDFSLLTLGMMMLGCYVFLFPYTAKGVKALHFTMIFIFSFILSLWTAQVSSQLYFPESGGLESFIITSLAIVIIFNLPVVESVFIYLVSFSILMLQNFTLEEQLSTVLVSHFTLLSLPFAIWVISKLSFSYHAKGFLAKKESEAANAMLRQEIEEHIETELRLKKMTMKLEKTVFNRTRKLLQTNQELQQEIFERKSVEEDLLSSKKELFLNNQRLQKVNDELDMFVYRTSHDMRSPLTSILGLINISDKEQDSEIIRSYLNMMESSVIKLDNYINEIVNYSKNSRLRVRKNLINFQNLLEEVLEEIKSQYENYKFVNFDLEFHCAEPFHSDNKRLFIIFYSLISNCIRFSRLHANDPYVKIIVETHDGNANISIEDNGQGIEEDQLPKVFEMFYRGTEKNHGSGLGLYIVKEALAKINGSINIVSKQNQGTTVSLSLPTLKFFSKSKIASPVATQMNVVD